MPLGKTCLSSRSDVLSEMAHEHPRQSLSRRSTLSSGRRARVWYTTQYRSVVAMSASSSSGLAVVDSQGHLSGVRLHEHFRTASVVKAMMLVAYLQMLGARHRDLNAGAGPHRAASVRRHPQHGSEGNRFDYPCRLAPRARSVMRAATNNLWSQRA